MRNMSREDKVQEFHRAFKHTIDTPLLTEELTLRHKLIYEEYTELRDELAAALVDVEMYGFVTSKTLARLLKEMADLQYVLSGLAVSAGLPLEAAFNRVHSSNMSKLGEDGNAVYREDGKILKGPHYAPPDIESLVEKAATVPGYEYYS